MNNSIDIIQEKFPIEMTWSEIAENAINNNLEDILFILLNTNEYLPIRWDKFITKVSPPILRMIYPKLSLGGKLEAACILHDKNLVDSIVTQYNIPEQQLWLLCIETGYYEMIHIMEWNYSVRSYPKEEIVNKVDNSNIESLLRLSIEYNRVDILDAILATIPKERRYELLSTIPILIDKVSKQTLEYLVSNKYISVTPVQEKIIVNDANFTKEDFIITNDDISMILICDADSFLKLIPKVPTDKYNLAYGKILKYLINLNNDSIDILIPLLFSASSDQLQTYIDENINLEAILTVSAAKGYIEILDKYCTEEMAIRILSSPYVIPSVYEDQLADFLDYKFGNGIQYESIWDTYRSSKLDPIFVENYLIESIISGNIYLISRIKKKYPIDNELRRECILLANQTHTLNPTLLQEIKKILK